jgi:hypothetical protein
MRTRCIRLLFFIAATTAILEGQAVLSIEPAAPSISLDCNPFEIPPPGTPPDFNCKRQSSFSLTSNVNIRGVDDLYAFQFDLYFDPTVVEVTNVADGKLVSGVHFIAGKIDNDDLDDDGFGSITFVANSMTGLVSGTSGPGTLATITFKGLKYGKSPIIVKNVTLLDSNLNEIPTNGGQFGIYAFLDRPLVTDPTPVTVCLGGSAKFSVTASGTGLLTHKWRKMTRSPGNRDDIPGETSSDFVTGTSIPLNFSIMQVSKADEAAYSVVVFDGLGTEAQSRDAQLTIQSAPNITRVPTPLTVCESQPVTFSVSAVGAAPLTYQWHHDNRPVGTESDTLTIPSATSADAGLYDVTVSDSCKQSSSPTAPARLIVNPGATLSETSLIIGREGGNPTPISVTGGCSWTAISNVVWIKITNINNGAVSFSIDANTGPQRVGTLTIAGKQFTVTQQSGGGVNDSRFVSQRGVPLTVQVNQSFEFEVTFRNTGTTTWTDAGGYELVSAAPINNVTWGKRLAVLTKSVPPCTSPQDQNCQVTFSFTKGKDVDNSLKAPSMPGLYRFEWQMVQNPVGFGDFSPATVITVTP